MQYGVNSIEIMASIGSTYLNFGLWAIALVPGWLVVRKIGVSIKDTKLAREVGEKRMAVGVVGKVQN
jgi:hypothetical protein